MWKVKSIKENGSYLITQINNGKEVEKKVHESQMLKWFDSTDLHNRGLVDVRSSLENEKEERMILSENNNNHSSQSFGHKVTEPISSLLKNREEERAQNEYEVEKILEKETDPISKQVKYLVKWKGYSNAQSTWERIKDLKNCKQAILDFENLEKLKDDGSTVKFDDPEYSPEVDRRHMKKDRSKTEKKKQSKKSKK
jgi:hypothetical protein